MVQWRDKEVSRGLGEQLEGWRGLGKRDKKADRNYGTDQEIGRVLGGSGG